MFEFDELEDLGPPGAPAAPAAQQAGSAAVEGLGAAVARRAAEDLGSKDDGARWDACRELAKLGALALPHLAALERLVEEERGDDIRRAARKALRELRAAGGAAEPSEETVEAVAAAQQQRAFAAAIAKAVASAPASSSTAPAPALPAAPSGSAASEAPLRPPGRAKEGKRLACLSWWEQQSQGAVADPGEGVSASELAAGQQQPPPLATGSRPDAGDAPSATIAYDDHRWPYREEPQLRPAGNAVVVGAGDDASDEDRPPDPEEDLPTTSWLKGRKGRRKAAAPPPLAEREWPADPLQLNFKIFESKTKFEVFPMKIDREGLTPAEVADIWERCWGVQYASRIRLEAPPDAPSRWLHPREDVVPSSPAVVRLESPGGSILYTLSAALRQYGAMSVEEAVEARRHRQEEAEVGARRRAEADARESKRYLALQGRQLYESRHQRA